MGNAMARDMWLSCKRPALAGTQVGLPDLRIKKPITGRPEIGAHFQLWIFSYTNLPLQSKKRLSRIKNINFVRRVSRSLSLGLPKARPDGSYRPAASFS
jgi:hypothetical protein